VLIPGSEKGVHFPPHAYDPKALVPLLTGATSAGKLTPAIAATILQPHLREVVTKQFAAKVIVASKEKVGGVDLMLSCQEIPGLTELFGA
jgi:hypothetical protein